MFPLLLPFMQARAGAEIYTTNEDHRSVDLEWSPAVNSRRIALIGLAALAVVCVAAVVHATESKDAPHASRAARAASDAVPIRAVEGRVVSTSVRQGDGRRLFFALIRWEVGPECSMATASKGTFDRVEVAESANDVTVTLFLRDGTPNQFGGDTQMINGQEVEVTCDVGNPVFRQLVALPSKPGKRKLIDGACGCPMPAMPKMDANRFLGSIKAR